MNCQKCRKEIQPHDVWECCGCRMKCCIGCVEPLRHVGQATRCHECAAVARNEEIRRNLDRTKGNR